jgi:Superinfection immunity protein
MLLMAYFIPTIVAARRLHRNRLAILMLNIFLGWTLIAGLPRSYGRAPATLTDPSRLAAG